MGQPMGETGVALIDISARPTAQPLTDRTRSQRLLQLGIAAGDLVLIVLATVLAAVGRTSLGMFDPTADINDVAQSVGLWIVAAWMLANVFLGTYARAHVEAGTIEYARICSAAGITAGAIGMISYLTKFNLSRGYFVLLSCVIGVPLLLLWRWIARRLAHRAHARGHLLTRVLISGSASHVDEVAAVLDRESWLGYRIVGALVPTSTPASATTPRGVPVVDPTGRSTAARRRGRATSLSSPMARTPPRSTSAGSPGNARATTCRCGRAQPQRDLRGAHGQATGGRRPSPPRSTAAGPRGLARAEARVRRRRRELAAFAGRWPFPSSCLRDPRPGGRLRAGALPPASRGARRWFLECLKPATVVVDAEARFPASPLSQASESRLFRRNATRSRPSGPSPPLLDRRAARLNVLSGDMSLVGPRPALGQVRRYRPDVRRRLPCAPA